MTYGRLALLNPETKQERIPLMSAPLPNPLRAQSLAELARLMIRNDSFNQLTAVVELRARKAIIRELIRRGVLERPAAPLRIDSLAYTNTVLPLIIEHLERAKA
jgi:hypothetical protein